MKGVYMAYVGSYSYTGNAKGIAVYDVDVEKGIYWLKKAVENEDPNATFVYAKYLFFGRLSTADDVLFETGVIPPDGVKEKEEALRYAKKAAELGCAAAEAWIQKVHE